MVIILGAFFCLGLNLLIFGDLRLNNLVLLSVSKDVSVVELYMLEILLISVIEQYQIFLMHCLVY